MVLRQAGFAAAMFRDNMRGLYAVVGLFSDLQKSFSILHKKPSLLRARFCKCVMIVLFGEI